MDSTGTPESFPPYDFYYALPGPPGSPLPPEYGPASQSTHSKSRSVFGDVSYLLFGRLTVGAGVRDFTDDLSFLVLGAQGQMATFRSTDPRFYAQYKVSSDVNVYASGAKGFRSGGFNQLGYPPYQPESVWTYELGSKIRRSQLGLGIDADVFWSDYDGYQIVGVAPPPALPQNIYRNAGAARIKGIEASVNWSAVTGWKGGLNGDYIDADS